MKGIFWLTRDMDSYTLWEKKPDWNEKWKVWDSKFGYFLDFLCLRKVKKYLKLKEHLPIGEKGIVKIELDIRCKLLK